MRVLVAEDDDISRHALKALLGKWGYEATLVKDGQEALDLFESDPFPILITDWLMPRMDGTSLVRRIRSRRNADQVYIIMLTVKSRKSDIVEGLEAGADDFVIKPFDEAELHSRLRVGQRTLELTRNLAARNRELEEANKRIAEASARIRQDLETATQVQESFLPSEAPNVPGLRFAWAFRPCEELAGDTFNVFRLDETTVGLYILDVSGHGVSSALLSASLSRVLSPVRAQSPLLKQYTEEAPGYRISEPAEVAMRLNQLFPMREDTGQYFTIIYAALDCETRKVRYVQAGHPSPIWLASTGHASPLTGGGLPIGFVKEARYEEQELQLSVGERLYFYSDGLNEALSPKGEMFSLNRLAAEIQAGAVDSLQDSVTRLVRAVEEWSGAGRLRDDVSLVALEIFE